MRHVWAGFAAMAAIACATTTDEGPRRIQETALAPQPHASDSRPPETLGPALGNQPFDPKTFTEGMVTPAECANAAKDLRQRNPERGWLALKACIEKGRFPRADFTDLRLVLNGAWDEDLANRPEAPQLLAKLVAMRGGDVDGDLVKLQAVRVPLFTLAAAVKQPQTYKGRYVLIRASLQDAEANSNALSARLVETTLSSQLKESEAEGRHYVSSSSSSSSWKGSVQTSRYGNFKGEGSSTGSSASRSTAVNARYENQKTPTGRVAIGRLAKPDPFLEPGKDYVFLGRFDGVRASPDDPEDAAPAGIVTILTYFQPSALLID